MSERYATDEDLLRRLPLPLAQLYRRAHNAKGALERHLTALYLWEASLKLLASVAVVAYAQRGSHDPQLAERLTNLARPSLGHWWEFTRLLVPTLADAGDAGFGLVRELLLGRTRDDLPRAAGLDAALRQELEAKSGARATIRLTELFDRLVTYRNKGVAHAAPGQRPDDFHERMATALLAALTELLGRLDMLAGRRLLYVAEVRQVGGLWLVQRYDLTGESARRIPSLELPRAEAARLPDGERVYLLSAPLSPPGSEVGGEGALLLPSPPLRGRGVGGEGEGELHALHPLLLYDAEAEEALFLNARRGRHRTEYLCYTSGRTIDRPDLGSEQRALLARVLGMAVAEDQAEQWASRADAAEPGGVPESPGPVRRTVGEFELLSELGRGGMGVVYRAWQPSLARQVALKCLLHGGDAKAEARFRREIRALGHVEHPHLVKVFTSGSDGDQWFYAMELIEGVPLSAVCDELQTRAASVTEVDLPAWQQTVGSAWQAARQAEKPLSDAASGGRQPPVPSEQQGADAPRSPGGTAGRSYVRHIVELLRQVAEAAHALHAAGVIHRDVKPGNILVSGDGSQAVLMDLGLAQLADDVEGRLTRTRQFVGTLRYASPQQVLAVGKLDRRTDVYSLGATLWELLALRPLYGATEQTPTPELMEKIQREEPDRLRRHHPGLSRDLEAVVHKCLEKDPARRYATARELAEDLGRYLAGEPVRARRVGGLERSWKWMKRHPWQAGLAAAGVVLVLLLVAGGVALSFDSEVRRLNDQLQKNLGLTQRLNDGLQAAVQEAEKQRNEAERQHQEVEKAQRARHRLAVESAARADWKLALAAAHAGRFAGAEQILYKAAGSLRGEPELAELRGQIEAARDRLSRVAAFYRASDRAERLGTRSSEGIFSPADDTVIASWETALQGLGVGEAREWWKRLPADELRPEQRQRLTTDVVMALDQVALWKAKEGFVQFEFLTMPLGLPAGSKARAAYLAAREDLGRVQAYYVAVHGRRSVAADLIDLFIRDRLKEPLPAEPLRLEQLDTVDWFFYGLAHSFVGAGNRTALGPTLLKVISPEFRRLSGVNFDAPLPAGEQMLRTAAGLDPERYLSHLHLGMCLLSEEDYAGAEQAFNTCLGLRPDDMMGYLGRGQVRMAQAEATQAQQQKLLLAGNDWWIDLVAQPRPQAGGPLLDVTLYAAGQAQIQEYWDRERNRGDVLAWAVKGLDQGLARLPDESMLHWERGLCLNLMGRSEEAMAGFTTAAELEACRGQADPSWVKEPLAMAKTFRTEFQKLAGNKPNDPAVQAVLALTCLAAGADAEAERAAAVALAQDPQNAPARAVRGVLLLRGPKAAEALRDLDAVPAAGPGGTLATFGRAWSCEATGDWARAREAYDRLLLGTGPANGPGAVPGWLQLEAHLGRARAFAGLGQIEDARHALEDARAIDPPAAERLTKKLLPEDP